MRVAFISDLHLHARAPDTLALATHYLDTALEDVSSLYILGDLFDAWVGDDDPVEWASPFVRALHAVHSRGTSVHLMHGNRDFLLGEVFAARVQATLHREDRLLITLGEHRALLMHGDTLCTDDTDYLSVRETVRSSTWQRDFLRQPLATRHEHAQALRNESRLRTAAKDLDMTDANPGACEKQLREADADWLIHGHTHRPAVHDCGPGTRFVLGEWLAEGATVGVFDGQDMRLERWPSAD